MKLISDAAQHYGIAVLVAGDFDQISAVSTIESNGSRLQLSPARLNFIRSSKQGVSFRSLNS
jgi:archaellum component FlaG (FlaF/FlaG flagellin family)